TGTDAGRLHAGEAGGRGAGLVLGSGGGGGAGAALSRPAPAAAPRRLGRGRDRGGRAARSPARGARGRHPGRRAVRQRAPLAGVRRQPAPPGVQPCSALVAGVDEAGRGPLAGPVVVAAVVFDPARPRINGLDRKSTRLNSSHVKISYAV